MHPPPLPLAAAAALVALSSVASASSLAAPPRTGFLQDVLSSRSAAQNYCKVRLDLQLVSLRTAAVVS